MPDMAFADAWYNSGTFWTGAGAAATLVVGIATVAVTFLTRFARPRLEYAMGTVTPLLTAPDGVRADLELSHRGVRLEHPYVVQVTLTGRGRRDIPRDTLTMVPPSGSTWGRRLWNSSRSRPTTRPRRRQPHRSVSMARRCWSVPRCSAAVSASR